MDIKTYELKPKYDVRQSFYQKAEVTIHKNTKNETIISLYSYNTLVSYIIEERNKAIVLNTYSNTTLRHIKEFLLQHGFKAETKAQIEQDYIKINKKVV